jgi:hypothetical protein
LSQFVRSVVPAWSNVLSARVATLAVNFGAAQNIRHAKVFGNWVNWRKTPVARQPKPLKAAI